ncbi:MAG: SGNH/GDSL hydrolase family protein [Bryobacteraceae bacterium]
MRRLLLVLATAMITGTGFAQDQHWVATWAASAQETAAAGATIPSFKNQTVRMVVNTSIPGRTVRVELSNTFGKGRLKIGAAHLALHDRGSAIVPASDRALTFSGSPSAVIPAGAVILSDPVDLAVPAVGDLVITLFLPEDTGLPTQHARGLHTTYISGPGNFAGQTTFTAASTSVSWYFISGVHVLASADTRAIVTFGDSITDGSTSTVDANAAWPSVLGRRLQAAGMKKVAVINHGIGGNRVVRDGTGMNALARFDRDVLAQPGVKYVVIMEGINDIGQGTRDGAPADASITAEELIAAYRQMATRAHEHGIQVIGATLTPYEGAAYYSAAGEGIRTAVNSWIRTSGAFDAYFDFDLVTRDPSNPKHIRSDFNITDNLHPNDTGYAAMADSIDLAIFR